VRLAWQGGWTEYTSPPSTSGDSLKTAGGSREGFPSPGEKKKKKRYTSAKPPMARRYPDKQRKRRTASNGIKQPQKLRKIQKLAPTTPNELTFPQKWGGDGPFFEEKGFRKKQPNKVPKKGGARVRPSPKDRREIGSVVGKAKKNIESVSDPIPANLKNVPSENLGEGGA